MKAKTLLGICSFMTAGMLAASTAHADQAEDHGLYLGAAYGMVRVEDSDFEDDNDFGKFTAGYQFLPFLGIEGSYYNFGEYGNSVISAETEATSLSVTGRIPLSRVIAIYASLGPVWWETDVAAGPFTDDFDGEDLKFGAGISFELSPNLDIRAEYDWTDVDLDGNDIDSTSPGDFDSELRTVSLGLKFQF